MGRCSGEIVMNKKAVILLSGGVDSKTCLAYAKDQGYDCYALTFNYGQRNHAEIDCASHHAKSFAVIEHRIVTLDIGAWGGSAITDHSLDVPSDAQSSAIPSTYVPARNTVFLSVALSYAEAVGADAIFIGVNAMDYDHYPDCRPEYIKAFETLAQLATKGGVEGVSLSIKTPLLRLSKSEIMRLGYSLGIDYDDTLSCYNPDAAGAPCQLCEACQLRISGLKDSK